MRAILIACALLCGANTVAQKDPNKLAEPIIELGKKLYRSEMASWYGTDVALEHITDRASIGGYFSYPDGDSTRCVFVSRATPPQVLIDVTFDASFSTETASVRQTNRLLTEKEQELWTIRAKAISLLQTDTLFKLYEGMNFNVIPVIHDGKKEVYVLSGPTQHGTVLFGNDYLIAFDKKNNVTSKKALHANLIPTDYAPEGQTANTMHSHLESTGDLPTATDICTLLLYSKFAGWEQHTIISRRYMSIWNCKTNKLLVMKMEAVDKIYQDQEERKKK